MARRPIRPARIRPYFVKVLFKGFSKKLMIPRKYVSLHGETTLGKKCVLWPTHTRYSWPVKTKKIDNELYFKKGWKVFAKDHSLKYGDLLIFRHVRNSEFDVDVLDISGTPREPVVFENVQRSRNSSRAQPGQTGRQKRNIVQTEALTAAESLISSSEFPCFKVIMKPAYLKPGGYLYVPEHYAKVHLKERPKDVRVEYLGKEWNVNVPGRRPCETRTFLNAGWSYIAKETNLQDDDVCVFQLISTKSYTLKLTIFRRTNAGRPDKTNLQTQTSALSAADALVASSEYPAFKKIMKRAYVKSGGCLHVPQHYAKEYFIHSTRDVKIEISDKPGTAMVLRLHPSETKTFLGGWSNLARENSLRLDDVCVFELINTKDCTLKLTIFKHTRGDNQVQGHQQSQVKFKSSDPEPTPKSKELSDKAFKCVKNQKRKQVEIIRLDSSDSELTPEPSPAEKAREEAEKFVSNSKHPSFLAIMRRAYVYHGFLHVPNTFVKEMRKGPASGNCEVKLQYLDNVLKGTMNKAGGGSCRINAGWKAFIKQESIKLDDVCVFELINKEDDVIKISVFKCNS
ncbi:B3 domain-containing protein REM14-like [Apium graveolens]|uniref:B3 domain-containing protein REM14-like n=1 Tax=Apium graveolens TaxID=4045 RepID=UPI003D78DC87